MPRLTYPGGEHLELWDNLLPAYADGTWSDAKTATQFATTTSDDSDPVSCCGCATQEVLWISEPALRTGVELADGFKAGFVQRGITPTRRGLRATHPETALFERDVFPLERFDFACAQTTKEVERWRTTGRNCVVLSSPGSREISPRPRPYLPSENGRKASLLAGGNGHAVQEIALQVPANGLHLVSVDRHGVARLKLRPRFETNDRRIVRIDAAPLYDAPPTIDELCRIAAKNHEFENAFYAERIWRIANEEARTLHAPT